MSLVSWGGELLGRRWVNDARKGKKGDDVKGFMAAVDGYKRIIVLGLALLQLWLLQVFHVDVSSYLHLAFAVLGWDPTQLLPVPPAVLATTVAGLVAIVDGIRKAIAQAPARKAEALKASAVAAK
jgi:hypothetical protein